MDAEENKLECVSAMTATSENAAEYLVGWTKCGTCVWAIGNTGKLTIRPECGNIGILDDWSGKVEDENLPWTVEGAPWASKECAPIITSVEFQGVIHAKTSEGMFRGCTNLTSLDLTNLYTTEVKSLELMFAQCSSLERINNLEHLDTSCAVTMSCMFLDCSKLSSINVANFDTHLVYDMSAMFIHCQSLTTLDLSKWDTFNVRNMALMFSACKGLKFVDLSAFDTSHARHMDLLFVECSSLPFLDLSNFQFSDDACVSNMFTGCEGLRALALPDGIDLEESGLKGAWLCATDEGISDVSEGDVSKAGSYLRL